MPLTTFSTHLALSRKLFGLIGKAKKIESYPKPVNEEEPGFRSQTGLFINTVQKYTKSTVKENYIYPVT